VKCQSKDLIHRLTEKLSKCHSEGKLMEKIKLYFNWTTLLLFFIMIA